MRGTHFNTADRNQFTPYSNADISDSVRQTKNMFSLRMNGDEGAENTSDYRELATEMVWLS